MVAHDDADGDDESGVGTTIVGGQPPGAPRRPLMSVPVGVERVLFAAASDEEFRAALLADRERAADQRGFRLSESERAMLRLAPEEQLRAAIAGLDTSGKNVTRRKLLRAVAATVTIAAGASGAGSTAGCDRDGLPLPADSSYMQPNVDMGMVLRDLAIEDLAEPPRPDFAGILPDIAPTEDLVTVDIAEPPRPDLAVIPDMSTPDLLRRD